MGIDKFCQECCHQRLFTSGCHYSYNSWFILSSQSNLHHFLLGEVRIKLQDCVLCTFVSVLEDDILPV